MAFITIPRCPECTWSLLVDLARGVKWCIHCGHRFIPAKADWDRISGEQKL